jgi:hypothetical protein
MANLDGSRSHGARWDVLAGAMFRDDPALFTGAYRVILHAARAEGIGPGRLPDFLELEHSGELTLLGQDELDSSALEASLRERITRHAGRGPVPGAFGWGWLSNPASGGTRRANVTWLRSRGDRCQGRPARSVGRRAGMWRSAEGRLPWPGGRLLALRWALSRIPALGRAPTLAPSGAR